jgi:hypothetical protein
MFTPTLRICTYVACLLTGSRARPGPAGAALSGKGKGKGKKGAGPTTAKIMRESRAQVVPALVFHIEQFEVLLLQFSKITKVRGSRVFTAAG